jgi:protein SCO1/2
MRDIRDTPVVVAALLGCAAAALVHPPAARAARWGADYFPNVPLVTQDGKVVHFYDDVLKGKGVAVNLIYTRCSASCPLETAKLSQVQRLLGAHVGKDVFFVSISIDPDHDTPEVLKAYAEKFHAGPGWVFLTGKMEDIRLVAKKMGLASLTDAASRDGHQPSLMIGNEPTGEWMRNSAVDNPQFLVATMSNFFHWNMGPAKSYVEARALPNVGQAPYIFGSRCAACHTIGKGPGVGPDLQGVTERRERAWLARYIAKPDVVLAEGDPIATDLFQKYRSVRMPNLELSSGEVSDLIDWIGEESKANAPRTDAPVKNAAMP